MVTAGDICISTVAQTRSRVGCTGDVRFFALGQGLFLAQNGPAGLTEVQTGAFDPELKSLIKPKFFVGAIGRGLADPPGVQSPDHPQ